MGDWNVIEDNDELKKEFEGYKDGLVRYGTEGWEQHQFQSFWFENNTVF